VLLSGEVVTEGASEQGPRVSRMSSHVASWLAWSLSMLGVAIFLAIVALYVLIRSVPQVPSSVSTRFTLTDLLIGVPFLAFPIVGALIASRHPHNPIGL